MDRGPPGADSPKRADWPVGYTADDLPIWGHKPTFKRVGVQWRGRKVYDTVVLCECDRFRSQQPNKNDARWEWRKHVRAATGEMP